MDQKPEGQPSSERAAEPVDAPGLVRWCISLLAAHAWQSMGLIPNPATHTIERNLADARLAIDAAGALAEQAKGRLDDPARRELNALLTDLRVNFVEQQARATSSSQSTPSSPSTQSTDEPAD